MKHLNLLSGIIIGVGFCLLISANSKTTLNEDVPRYHLSWSNVNTGYAYDAVTGDSKYLTARDIGKIKNIKTFLEQKTE